MISIIISTYLGIALNEFMWAYRWCPCGYNHPLWSSVINGLFWPYGWYYRGNLNMKIEEFENEQNEN